MNKKVYQESLNKVYCWHTTLTDKRIRQGSEFMIPRAFTRTFS